MSNVGLPAWVYGLILRVVDYEDIHGSDERCLDGALAAVPSDVLQVVTTIKELATREPEALTAIVAEVKEGYR